MSSVLYDAAGPRAKRRALVGSVVGTVALVGLLVVGVLLLASNGIFDAERWEPLQESVAWVALLERGLVATLEAAAVAAVLAFAAALVLAGLAEAPLKPVRWLVRTYVEVFRGLPVLLMMFFALLGLGAPAFWAVVIGLVLYNSAVFAEIIRAGVVSLPKGQREAGLAVGLTPLQTFASIQLPQALRRMLPSLVSQLVVLLKDTSLGYIVAYPELLRVSRELTFFYGDDTRFSFFVVTLALYLAVNISLSMLANWVDRRGRRRSVGQRVNAPEADAGA